MTDDPKDNILEKFNKRLQEEVRRDLDMGRLVQSANEAGIRVLIFDDDDLEPRRQCDCCGLFKRNVRTVWADHVGETSACPKCRGHGEDE